MLTGPRLRQMGGGLQVDHPVIGVNEAFSGYSGGGGGGGLQRPKNLPGYGPDSVADGIQINVHLNLDSLMAY